MPPRRSASGPMTATNAEASSSTSFSSVAAVDSPSPIIAKLRKMWQFAVVCQFMHTFDEAFGMSGFETESLERDLDGQETAVIPDLMRRLLYTLTLDRRVSIENWQDKTRNQFLKREPQNNPFGTVEEPRSWEELSLTQKVETLRAACEWHFQDSERFRKLVKSEEDAESWRIEPIGWDAKGNTYWLFDDNRLWVQYAPPPEPVRELPPASKGTKRARAEARRAAAEAKKAGTAMPSKAGRKPKVKKNHSSSNSSSSSLKRGRSDDTPNEDADEEEEDEYEDLLDDDDDEDEDDEGRNRKRLRTRTSKAAPLPRRNASRSAAADATRNIKRNAIENAAALADLQSSPSKRNGVRTSRRLKGGEGEEGGSDGEWESIPEELLREGKDDDDDESLSDPPSGDENENDSGSEDDEDQDQDQDQDQDEEMEEDGDQMEVESSSQDGKGIQENNFQSSSDRVDANGDSTMSEKEENSAQDQRIDGEVKADQDGTDDDKMQVDETNPEGSEVKVEKTEEEKRQEEEDKVEFETVAVTLLEWDAIINQFSKARHPDEKNLYKFLKDEIYPKVTKELAELEKARAQEMLLASRKRSSRIAIKESEKEEKERDRIARMSMEERMSGVRAEEEEKFSKEDLAKQREWERERKIKEREERALAREKEAEEKARKEELERIQKEIERDERQRRRDDLIANGGDPSTVGSSPEPFDKAPQVQAPVASKSGSKPASAVPKKKGRPSKKQAEEVQQPKGKATEDWELSCEVCGSRGKNLQESSQIVCCEQCGVWQHVKCWNNQDKRMGAETLRKWSEIDFYCSKCKPPKDPQFMPPYPNSKPLPAGFVVQRLKRPPRNRNSISKDPEEGKGKEKEGTPVEKKPRAPPKPRGSNASTSSTAPSSPAVGQAQSQAQAQAPLPAQTANLQQPAAQQSTLQALSSQANGHSAPSASAQHTIEAQSHQQPSSSTQAPPGNLALGSLPPPILNNTNGSPSTNGLGSAFVHQPSNQSPSINGIPRSSPGASISNQSNSIMSPRSPSGLPRSNQPSGSFPIRRDAPARSPLSRPYDSPTDIPPLTIERPQSPTPNLGGHSRNGSGSSTMTPLQRGVAASSNSNPTFSSNGPSTNGDKNALYQRQVAAPSSSSSRSEGPGPISGSIRQRLPSDPSKQFGPSPPRQLYGSSDPSSSSSTSNSITPPNSNGNGSMAPPSSRPFQQPNSNLVNQTPISSNDSVPMQIDSTSSVQVPQANVSNQQSSSSNPPPPSS